MGMKYLNYRQFLLLVAFLVFKLCACPASAQYYYVNSYSARGNNAITTAVYKIDLASKRVVDSLYLGLAGEFINNRPLEIQRNRQPLMVALLNSGIPGKNSPPQGIFIARYAIINKNEFQILHQDSMPNYFIYDNISSQADSIKLDWIENTPGLEGHYIGWFIPNFDDNRINLIRRQSYNMEYENENIIGQFYNSSILLAATRLNYYWGLRDGLEAVIFKTDNSNNVLSQITVGDRNISSILAGYNPLDSLIYVFKLRFYLETYAPPISSPDSVTNVLERFRPFDFSLVDQIRLPENPYIIANEAGNAEFINGCFVYYYSESEDYRSFQPASVFIFDTRTNEATWLRVGWR
jgi:hypothetical protein